MISTGQSIIVHNITFVWNQVIAFCFVLSLSFPHTRIKVCFEYIEKYLPTGRSANHIFTFNAIQKAVIKSNPENKGNIKEVLKTKT